MDAPAAPQCIHCVHFVVTWETESPRGCRAFGIKGRQFPAVVVKRESGIDCQAFQAKDRTPAATRQP